MGKNKENEPDGWSKKSHSNKAEPDYEEVFSLDQVSRIDITIASEDWQAMLDDMEERCGEFGSLAGEKDPGDTITEQRIMAILMQGEKADEPIWVPCTVRYDDRTWPDVGIRFKGNSSLLYSWAYGNLKLPLKLDFDKYRDDKQRFYGFGKVALGSNYGDASFIREVVSNELFRDWGTPSARAAFYRVYIDHGEGSIYFGLYTMVEVMEDTAISSLFDDDDGNLYKPDGKPATFAYGSFDESGFYKKTNEDEEDWSDVRALYDTLHDESREKDRAAWRQKIEACFDVEAFIRWLAFTTVAQNWDTYGNAPHNYYLYTNPETGQVTMVPWDHNEMLKAGSEHAESVSLSLDEVESDWPLIRYLADEKAFHSMYTAAIYRFATQHFTTEHMTSIFQNLHYLVAPHVVGDDGEQAGYSCLESDDAFYDSLQELIAHVESRTEAVNEFLAG